jgi:ABC-type phosphate/phosphonate transport system ATPase subunit
MEPNDERRSQDNMALVNIQLILVSNPSAANNVKRGTGTDKPICQCHNNQFCKHEGEASLEMVTKLLGQTVEQITMHSFRQSF